MLSGLERSRINKGDTTRMPQTKRKPPATRSARPKNDYAGNITIARGRFRRMSELALVHFRAKDFNLAVDLMARFIRVNTGSRKCIDEFTRSLKREHRKPEKAETTTP